MDIRKALPEDTKRAVPLIYSSGPEAFEYVFSVDYEGQAKGFLSYAFKRNYGVFSHLNHTVVDREGRVVGSMVNYTARDFIKLNLGSMKSIVGYYGVVKGLRVMYRGVLMETLIRPPKKHCYYVGHLGVDAELRGQGIGQALIVHAETLVKEASMKCLSLDVSEQNPAAERLYQRLGFKTVETRIFRFNKPSLPTIPSHHYMEADC